MITYIGVNGDNKEAVRNLCKEILKALAGANDMGLVLTGLAITTAYILDHRPLPEQVKTFAVAAMVKVVAGDADINVDHVIALLKDMDSGSGEGSVPGPIRN